MVDFCGETERKETYRAVAATFMLCWSFRSYGTKHKISEVVLKKSWQAIGEDG